MRNFLKLLFAPFVVIFNFVSAVVQLIGCLLLSLLCIAITILGIAIVCSILGAILRFLIGC